MLHLIFQAPVDCALLQRIEKGDDVVFFENSIFQLYKGALLNDTFQGMLSSRVSLYVLAVELEARGIKQEELVSELEVIDYAALLELTENNKVVRTWN